MVYLILRHRKCGGKLAEQPNREPYRWPDGSFESYPLFCLKCFSEIKSEDEIDLEKQA